jgi:hypothetical protein
MGAALTQAPLGFRDTTAEDEAAMGTAFAFIAFIENESMGKGARSGKRTGQPRSGTTEDVRPAMSQPRLVDPAMPPLT